MDTYCKYCATSYKYLAHKIAKYTYRVHSIQDSKSVSGYPDSSQARGPLSFRCWDKDIPDSVRSKTSFVEVILKDPQGNKEDNLKAKKKKFFFTIRVLRVTFFGNRVQVIGAAL